METRDQAGAPPTVVAPNWIGGRRENLAGPTRVRRNPARYSDVVTIAPESDADAVERACRTTRQAQRTWARVPAPERARVLGRLAALLVDQREAIARFVTREIGQPLREARVGVREASELAEFFAGEGRRSFGHAVPSAYADQELSTRRRPLGVVALITSAESPLAAPMARLAPALLAGNAVVWKPAEDAPGTAALLAELLAVAGLPPGVLAVVHGGGEEAAGSLLVARVVDGAIDQVSFTGSTATGRAVGELCGRALTVPCLTLGGKNPLVILADADLEAAIEGAVWSAFASAGQLRASVANVIVDRRVFPLVREQLVRRVAALIIGDPRREEVDFGPLVNERALQRYIAQRGVGVDEGAELLLDGRRIGARELPPSFCGDAEQGLYVTPRLFQHVQPTMRIATEECLGPTLNLLEVGSLDEAIAAATASPYALAAAIYTRDARAMLRFRDEVNAGMISVNAATIAMESHLPQGGNGWSGNGTRVGGPEALEAFTRWQSVNVDLSGRFQRPTPDGPDAVAAPAPDFGALGA